MREPHLAALTDMRPNGLLWIAVSTSLCWLGCDALAESMRHSGPYAEVYILFGGTVVALGLVAMSFAFKQRVRIKTMAQHMGRDSRRSRILTPKTSKVARNESVCEQEDQLIQGQAGHNSGSAR